MAAGASSRGASVRTSGRGGRPFNPLSRTLRPGAALLAAVLLAAFLAASGPPKPKNGPAPIRFENAAEEAGLRFVHHNHPTERKHLIETMPGGVAVFDYNNDGLPDIYFTNGADVPSLEKRGEPYWNRLFRNDGGMRFTDVTQRAGVAGAGYSMGAAAGDYNNDGHVDLFVAGVYRNLLLRNEGDGTFRDVTEESGIKSDQWGVAGGWFDYDNDGLLDLFVVNYSDWSAEDEPDCRDPKREVRTYCHPRYYEPRPNQLYRNLGGGVFQDVSKESGVARHAGRGMSVAFADYDGDGWLDAFVTNDNLPDFLFRNRGDGTFEEAALMAGAALPANGQPIASMGADFADYNNDGLPDITVTALFGETFPLFRNEGDGFFLEATYESKMAALSNSRSGWGNGFFDFNNDGWKDLFTANSHVNDLIHLFEPKTAYKQPNSVFANRGDGTFEDQSAQAGEEFQTPRAHRGAGFADFDRDGKIDVAVTVLGEPAELWRNVSPVRNHWLNLKLTGRSSNRDGIGARIEADGQHAMMTTAVGYASSRHDGVHFGLGAAQVVNRMEIRWPAGTVQVLEDVKADQVLEVSEPAE